MQKKNSVNSHIEHSALVRERNRLQSEVIELKERLDEANLVIAFYLEWFHDHEYIIQARPDELPYGFILDEKRLYTPAPVAESRG